MDFQVWYWRLVQGCNFLKREFGNKNLTDARTCEMQVSLAQPRKCGNHSNHQNEELLQLRLNKFK